MSRRLSLVVPAGRSAVTALFLAFVALVATAFAAPSAHAAVKRAAKPVAAKVTLTQLKVAGQRVTIRGAVTLPSNTARQRRRTKVAFTLKDGKGKTERFAAGIDAKRAFKLTRATKLTGRLSLAVRATIGGKNSGRATTRALTVRVVTRRTTTPGPGGGASTPTPGGGTPTPDGGGSTPTPPAPTQGTPLVGLFRLDEGRQAISGRLTGTWFSMGIVNADSTALDKSYTLLRPGTDGGLRTDVYQVPPTPAFAGTDPVSGGPSGDALANRIVRPQTFFSTAFSIVTAPTDPQLSLPDPLPGIVNDNGTLGGQITAWSAQWNGLSFNQGTPKPDGTLPVSPSGGRTTPLSGRYDAASRHFVLTWRSLIVGGPFSGFLGEWHLEGTFEPAA
ncbi:hypothetical protein [Conexibacter sp. CPCC 206217]|uniref:hypothetical protein n=1 Tax=Conexibacter sp. CPCC 206217 TaxID=3064574 RepID=UPI00271672BA|nr:hypothetical protein [Conexibacter sp. CPCC 206217]MDO8212315.1 hypothetical protein [Conexibacter sp. CPCC 206217]